MSLRRSRAACAFVVIAVTAPAACSPEQAGVVGLTLGPGGETVAVVAVCKGHIDGLTVWWGEDGEERDLGSWRHDTAIRDEAELPLRRPGTGWRTERALEPLPTGADLHVYGWTEHGRWSAPGLTFTTEDLTRLRAGEVWFERYDDRRNEYVTPFVPRDRFRAEACEGR